MIFTEQYESDLVLEIQRIIRASTEFEAEKNQPHNSATSPTTPSSSSSPSTPEPPTNDNNNDNKTTPPQSQHNDLHVFYEKCHRVETVRQLKTALHKLTARLDRDLEHINNPPPPSRRRNFEPLPDKQFTACNSMLTDLLEVRHFRTIYNIFVVILLMLLVNTVVHDYVADGSLNVGLQPIRLGFRNFHLALIVWSQMQLMSAAVFVLFALWSHGRRYFESADGVKRLMWDYGAVMAFVVHQLAILGLTVWNVLEYDLPIVSSIAVLMELCRFLMKNHAFVRSNVPKMLVPKPKTDDDDDKSPAAYPPGPTFGAFVYFQFAPTLVYRDAYPRNHTIRWSLVAWSALEVIGVIYYVSFIFERFLLQYYRTFGSAAPMSQQSMVVAIFGSMLPATVAHLCGFYCLLHAWMNAWAEVLRFGDRQFYKDWWNACSFDVYYRTWNCVVHDWLYAYVFRDVYELCLADGRRSTRAAKAWATVAVFTLSALFHELVLALAFRFFYPVLLTLFLGMGMLLSFVRLKRSSRAGNIFLWFSLALGDGLCMSLYCMEFFARVNCEVAEGEWTEYLVPVSWRCSGLL